MIVEGKSRVERIYDELLFLINQSGTGRLVGTVQNIYDLFRPGSFLKGSLLSDAIAYALEAGYTTSLTIRKPVLLDEMIVVDREERLGEYVYFLSVARKEGGGRDGG